MLFLAMFVTMVWRVEDYWEESSARIAIHVALAIALFFLLAIKILIPRKYRKLMGHLFMLGIMVYLFMVTLILNTMGYYLIWKVKDREYVSWDENELCKGWYSYIGAGVHGHEP